MDIQDPTFFMDKDRYIKTRQTIDEMLYNYADLQLDEPQKKQVLSNNGEKEWI